VKTANYSIQLAPEVKSKAEETFSQFGLNLSEAINVFLHMSIMQRGFPFEIREPGLSAETLLAMQETEQILDEYDSGLRSAKHLSSALELFEAMDTEDEADE